MCFIPFTTRDKKGFWNSCFFLFFSVLFFGSFFILSRGKTSFSIWTKSQEAQAMPCYPCEKINQHEFYKTDNYSQIKRNVLRPN